MTSAVLSRDELHRRREQLARTWAIVVAGPSATQPVPAQAAPEQGQAGQGGPGQHLVERRVLDSWRRSRASVGPEVSAAPVDRDGSAVDAWRRSGVAAGLRAVEADVRRAADDGGLVAGVTDASGRIVWTHGSRVMRRHSERVGFVPGGHWDEASVGTNALALALRTGEPSTVYSAEHYSAAVHGWVCYAVPLRDPRSGAVLGVLDLSTTWDRAHPLAMSTAAALGRLLTSASTPDPAASLPTLELSVLGGWRVCTGATELLLPRRQLEILTLLSLHPAGLSLEQLHARLYGDAPVALSTLKAEVSHLRTALAGGIGSRPYRLTVPVSSDVSRVLHALDHGDVTAAVAASAGPLLPGSDSPDVVEWRAYVEVALRTGVLGCRDPEVVRQHADAHPYDEQLQRHLLDVLAPGDPRRAGAQARWERARSS